MFVFRNDLYACFYIGGLLEDMFLVAWKLFCMWFASNGIIGAAACGHRPANKRKLVATLKTCKIQFKTETKPANYKGSTMCGVAASLPQPRRCRFMVVTRSHPSGRRSIPQFLLPSHPIPLFLFACSLLSVSLERLSNANSVYIRRNMCMNFNFN